MHPALPTANFRVKDTIKEKWQRKEPWKSYAHIYLERA